ncbi:hypothetical protein ACOYW6_13330 [Parablastomonas sp. CN1-191]|uniref:hypothetical protein n=1 Tax=Parablastomonas sp. CN1-191 TaxID=3400908 RepID=UPI003BF79096
MIFIAAYAVASAPVVAQHTQAATPSATASVENRWGPYAIMADQEWFLFNNQIYVRYSWIKRGETMRVQRFRVNGERVFESTLVMNGGITTPGTPVTPASRITSLTKLKAITADSSVTSVDPAGKFFSVEWTAASGHRNVDRYNAVVRPAFAARTAAARPDPSQADLAIAPVKSPCPATMDDLARFLKGFRIKSSKAETNGVTASDFTIFGSTGEAKYEPGDLLVLGQKPVALEADISGGKPFILTAFLPGSEPTRYSAEFRRSVAGNVTCDQYGCGWHTKIDFWKDKLGALTDIYLARDMRRPDFSVVRCEYKSY